MGKHFSCQGQYKAKIDEMMEYERLWVIAAQNFSTTWNYVSDGHQVHQLDVSVFVSVRTGYNYSLIALSSSDKVLKAYRITFQNRLLTSFFPSFDQYSL